MSPSLFFYIPNSVRSSRRGEGTADRWGSLEYSTDLARLGEAHGWEGSLIGTGWGRPESFTLATALAARTETFKPLVAARPGYWQPAQFASAAATLDHLSGGRLLVNVVSGVDAATAYGDELTDPVRRYGRTAEFIEIVRRLWAGERLTFDGDHYHLDAVSLGLRPHAGGWRTHPTVYFGGASEPAQRVAAAHADVQLFWGEPLIDVAGRIDVLKQLSRRLDRRYPPLEFGLRITALVRETSAEAWHDAEARVAEMATAWRRDGEMALSDRAVGQQRLLDLSQRGEVLDSCLYTAPGRYGGGGSGTTWLVGSVPEVAQALAAYARLGIGHFIISDTPYRSEIIRHGDHLLPALRAAIGAPTEIA